MLRVALARRRVATKVVVSGGGPAGLVTALALGRAGTPCALVEPRTAPSAHPRAHVLTARTLEICEDLGLGDALRQIAPPLERWRRFRYCDRVDGARATRSMLAWLSLALVRLKARAAHVAGASSDLSGNAARFGSFNGRAHTDRPGHQSFSSPAAAQHSQRQER